MQEIVYSLPCNNSDYNGMKKNWKPDEMVQRKLGLQKCLHISQGNQKNWGPDEMTQRKLGIQKYLPISQVLKKCHLTEDYEVKSSDDHNEIKVSVLAQTWNGMNLEQRVFVKIMLKSHASVGYLLRLPTPFCKRYLPAQDTVMTLESERGERYEAKYLPRLDAFSAGWRRFAIDQKLVQGDVVLFHLVESTRFKVYIIKTDSSTVKWPTHLLNLYRNAILKVPDTSYLFVYKRREARHSVQRSNKESGNDRGINFSDITGREDFNSTITAQLLQNHEFSESTLNCYYELCRSQNAFLHAELLKGLNVRYFAGSFRSSISKIVSIASALKTCTVSTLVDNFSQWNKTLKYYGALGMNVGFLCARLHHLKHLAVSSDGPVNRIRYIEACCERPRAESEVKKLEIILAKLRKASVLLAADVKTYKSNVGWGKYMEAYFRLMQAKDEIRELEDLLADFDKFFEHYDAVIETLKLKVDNHERQFQEGRKKLLLQCSMVKIYT